MAFVLGGKAMIFSTPTPLSFQFGDLKWSEDLIGRKPKNSKAIEDFQLSFKKLFYDHKSKALRDINRFLDQKPHAH